MSLSRIYNAPVTNHNFELKKDEHTQLDHKRTPTISESSDVVDVKQAVDEYYALQNKYATYKKTVIARIMSNTEKTRTENIKQVQNTIFKCINCKQKGGTKFWKDTDNNLRAVCGNVSTPCNLNFSILASLTMSADETRDESEGVENAKREIIQLKMDTLFGYVDGEKSVEQFKTNMEIIHAEMLASDHQHDVSDQKKMITKKMRDVYGELEMIRKLKHEYQP
jgi:Tfp pilus assembly protein PilE